MVVDRISPALREFLKFTSRDYPFPGGGALPIPLAVDSELATAILATDEKRRGEFIGANTDATTVHEAYQCAVFPVRMATLAVRKQEVAWIDAVPVALALGGGCVDWRDLLKCLSVVDYCCRQLSIELSRLLEPLDTTKLRNTLAGFQLRDPAKRGMGAMGIAMDNTPDGVIFRNRDP